MSNLLFKISATATGTNTYTFNDPTAIEYSIAGIYLIKFDNANTGAATLNINGAGAKAIVKKGNVALVQGDIRAGSYHLLVYDGTNFEVINADATAVESLFIGTADTTVASTAAETTILGTGQGSLTIPANSLAIGDTILILIKGHVSDTGNPTLTARIDLGGTEVCASGAITLGAVTTDYFEMEVEITVRTLGATGTVVAGGELMYDNSNDITGAGLVKTTATTIDTTGTLAIDVTVQWGTSSASNTITSQIITIEKITK